jgi:hypothetical protein
MRGRTVTLVVCDGQGRLLGQTRPFEVDIPWWQETEPIAKLFPALTILRLLRVTARPPGPAGGHVTYLAEAASPASLELELEPSQIDESLLADHPLRMPWARPGGPAADLEWATAELRCLGYELADPPQQVRTWNLSSIWRLPVRRGGRSGGRVWVKCVPHFLGREPVVLDVLRGESVPALLAADGHRMLLDDLPGEDGYEATLDEAMRVVDTLVELQVRTIERVPALVERGVPDARREVLAASLERVVERNRDSAPPAVAQIARSAATTLAEVDRLGLPDVLVHGDAHPGNARIGIDPPIIYDWGDSRIGNPLLDLAVTIRAPDEIRGPLVEHWLARWREAVPGSEPERAWELLRPIALLREAVVFQEFLDGIEPSERVYHETDVQLEFDRAAAALIDTFR